MSGSGKAGNGRGNNRKQRPIKRRENNSGKEGGASQGGHESSRNFSGEKGRGRHGGENQSRQNRRQPQKQKADLLKSNFSKRSIENQRGENGAFRERLKWVPPKINSEPLPVPDCPWCGKPIRDISMAISDRGSEDPVHFECVAARIAGGETLEKGDVVTYIGGGRFGVVCFGGSGASHAAGRDFRIKKVIEWENKDKRAEWRSLIGDRYSVT